jgi:hypothetical protein
VGSRGSAEHVHRWAGHIHAAFPIAAEVLTALIGTRADHGAEVESAGIRGNERFGEEDEACAFGGCLAGESVYFLERAVAVKDDGGSLHNSDLESLWGSLLLVRGVHGWWGRTHSL